MRASSFWLLCVVVEAAPIGALSFPCHNGQDMFLSLLVLCLLVYLQAFSEVSPTILMPMLPEIVTPFLHSFKRILISGSGIPNGLVIQ